MAKQNVLVELFYDGAWNEQLNADGSGASSVSERADISITRGAGAEQGEPAPSSCTLTFDNRDGRYNPRNASSPLFGKIGRNTPVRVSAGPGPVLRDNFNRVAAGWAGGLLWTLSGGAVPGDYNVNGTKGFQVHPAANVIHFCSVQTGTADHRVRATINLSVGTPGGAGVTVFVLGRMADTANWYAARMNYTTAGEVTFGLAKTVGGVGSLITDLTTTHAGYTGLFGTFQFTVELLVEGSTLRGRIWDSSNHPEPSHWNVTATDTDLPTGNLAGVASRRDAGNTDAGLVVAYDSFQAVPGTVRFTGEIASWKPRRAVKGNAWTDVTAAGILRRTEQSGALRSPLYRAHMFTGPPLAYWPMEDAKDADSAASAIPGIAPMERIGKRPGTQLGTGNVDGVATFGEEGSGGSAAVVGLRNGGQLRGTVPLTSATSWRFEFAFRYDAGSSAGFNTFPATLHAGPWEWSLGYADVSNQLQVVGGAADGSVVGINMVAAFDAYDGVLHNMRLNARQNGANVDHELYVDGVGLASATWNAFTLPVPRIVWANFYRFSGDDMASVSHYALYVPIPSFTTTGFAADGHAGETAAARAGRLSGEQDIEFTLIGADNAEAMGVQPMDTFNAVLAECERTDAARLFEARTGGIAYRTRDSLHNPTAVLTLDYEGGQIAPGLEPDIDDLNVRNDVTVKRTGGTFARAVQETGPLNVQDPRDDPDGVGRYAPPDIEVNTETDAVLPDHAGWRLHLGTVPDTRWPAVTVDLDAAPTLATAASRLDVGDALAIDNLPDELAQVLLMVNGYTETIGTHRRLITYNCEPASPYRVFVLDTDELDDPAVVLAL